MNQRPGNGWHNLELEPEVEMDLKPVETIIEKHQDKRTALISILHDIQDRYNHLPQGALRKVASRLRMDLTEIYGVAKFYKSFSLAPRGKHSITLCLGTACHVRGGARILDYLENLLKVKAGGTTKDLAFTLETVNCLGACALGPIMVVDRKYHGRITLNRIESILKQYP